MTNILKCTMTFLFFVAPMAAEGKSDSLKTKKQYANTAGLTVSNFSIAKLTEFNPYIGPGDINTYLADQFGIYVEHGINRHIKIGVAYNAWNTNNYLHRDDYNNDPYGFHDFLPMYIKGAPNTTAYGALRFRYGYKMYDLSISYVYDKLKRNKFTAGAGFSYANGTNFYVYQRYYNANSVSEVYILREQKKSYPGLILPCRYDFSFLKDKLSVGLQCNFRKYFGLYSYEIDYGLHLGYNF